MRARSIAGASLVLLALTTIGCDDDQREAEPPGTGAPAFEGAPKLISALGELAIECSSERTFDPIDNVSRVLGELRLEAIESQIDHKFIHDSDHLNAALDAT